jgi:hypothetical protein
MLLLFVICLLIYIETTNFSRAGGTYHRQRAQHCDFVAQTAVGILKVEVPVSVLPVSNGEIPVPRDVHFLEKFAETCWTLHVTIFPIKCIYMNIKSRPVLVTLYCGKEKVNNFATSITNSWYKWTYYAMLLSAKAWALLWHNFQVFKFSQKNTQRAGLVLNRISIMERNRQYDTETHFSYPDKWKYSSFQFAW